MIAGGSPKGFVFQVSCDGGDGAGVAFDEVEIVTHTLQVFAYPGRHFIGQSQAAGFDLPVPVASWLLLEALRVPRASWPLVLTPWNNQLPTDDEGLRQLMVSIRHQGLIAEHPIAGNYSWSRTSHMQGYLDWESGGPPPADRSWPLCDDDGFEWETGYPTSEGWSPPAEPAAESYYDEDGWMACPGCGASFDDDEGGDDNDTDTEDEADPSSFEYQAYLGGMSGATYEAVSYTHLTLPTKRIV